MSIKIISEIEPAATNDTYALMDAKYLRGGFEIVDTASDIDSLSPERLPNKMLFVKDENLFYTWDGAKKEVVRVSHKGVENLEKIGYVETDSQDNLPTDASIIVLRFEHSGNLDFNFPDVNTMRNGCRVYVHSHKPEGDVVTIKATNGQTIAGASEYEIGSQRYAEFIADADSDSWLLVMDTDTLSSGGESLEIDDGQNNVASVSKINLEGASVTKIPNSNGMGKDEITLTCGPTVKMSYGSGESVNNAKEIDVYYPLEVNTIRTSPSQDPNVAFLSIKPDAYEPMQVPSLLTTSSNVKTIPSGKDTTIFCDEPITPYGIYFSKNEQLGGINIEETNSADPNLGGQLTELLGSIWFEGGAPSDGSVKIWFMYHQNGASIPTGYVSDVKGNPIIVEKQFLTGQTMNAVISGAYYAKGLETITMHVEHSFSGEEIAIIPEKTLFCANQFQQGSEESVARIVFQRRNGISLYPSVYKFDKPFARLSESLSGVTRAEASVQAGEGQYYLQQFGINNLTPCLASVTNGVMNIKDNNVDTLDFYIDYLMDSARTRMMRGKTFTASVEMENKHNTFRLGLFKWTGRMDVLPSIYTGRSGGSFVYSDGWELVGSESIVSSHQGMKTVSKEFTIPDDAVNIAFALYPEAPSNPVNITISEFTISPETEYTGYTEIGIENLNEKHFATSDEYLELGQNSQGYAGLRYTLNYNPVNGLPLPVGEKIKGNAPFTLDKTKNVVSGSTARGGEGALVAGADGQVSVSCSYLLRNEQSTDTVVDFWWILYDVDDNPSEIPDSRIQFTVPANTTTHSIEKVQPAFVFEIEKGQSFALVGSANKNDGAFLETTSLTKYLTRPIIEFKELTVTGSDDESSVLDATRQGRETAGDKIYTAALKGSHEFSSASSADVVFTNLPAGSIPILTAYKKEQDGSLRSTAQTRVKFDPSTSTATVSFGETAETVVIWEVMS